MHKILFLPHNKEITVKHGENLIRAAMEAGVHINASCGGEGVCGKCRVLIEHGEVEGGITEKLSKDDIEKGFRQACIATVKSDLVVRIPIESHIDTSVLNMQATPRRTPRITEMNLDELKDLKELSDNFLRNKKREAILTLLSISEEMGEDEILNSINDLSGYLENIAKQGKK
jgi:uncharacterized 2Fe-2S/4Fe-4S cluster protein (DUF4445 family)